MNNPIEEKRHLVQERISKSFDSGINVSEEAALEKAAAAIGEIRHWKDGVYKKIEYGKWVQIHGNKEKKVGDTRIKKIISEEYDLLQKEFDKIKNEFESNIETKYAKGTMAYNVFFENAWCDEISKNNFIRQIKQKQKDLNDELKEIKHQIELSKKKKREEKIGKKEIDYDDLNKIGENYISSVRQIREIPKYIKAEEAMPVVTIDDYFLDTEAKFENLYNDTRKDLNDIWNKMKEESGFSFHKSPKSDSEYLIDKKNGDIYRYANHWFRVASCEWSIDSVNGYYGYDIAKCNIKNFKRKSRFGLANYLNPNFRLATVNLAESYLPKLRELTKDNEKFYLTDKAKKRVNDIIESIWSNLKYSAGLSIKEIEKMKKKYDFI
jgi:predicted metal-binding transcription factor (methanogenesis marker protein 9)